MMPDNLTENSVPPELSVVVPVYNEVGNIEEFLRRLIPLLEANVESYEIIFAVDPSTDGTESAIAAARRSNRAVKMLRFSRRFGQPTATLAGIEHARGRAVVVMDVDLQDPPEVLVEMLSLWRAGSDVVYAKRRQRTGETLVKRAVAKVGYAVINRFSDVPIPRDTGDFRLLDRRVVDHLNNFGESHGFLRGLVALVGFEQTEVLFDRPARHAGKGNYNRFIGSLRIGLNGLVAFSSALLNLATVLGFFFAFLALVTGIGYAIAKLAGAKFPVGNPTVVTLVLLMAGVQLVCLGIIGQYVGRIYEEVKHRPRYILSESLGWDDLDRTVRRAASPPQEHVRD
jgi:glycosyltransferase involved in cell wall biosynthesis